VDESTLVIDELDELDEVAPGSDDDELEDDPGVDVLLEESVAEDEVDVVEDEVEDVVEEVDDEAAAELDKSTEVEAEPRSDVLVELEVDEVELLVELLVELEVDEVELLVELEVDDEVVDVDDAVELDELEVDEVAAPELDKSPEAEVGAEPGSDVPLVELDVDEDELVEDEDEDVVVAVSILDPVLELELEVDSVELSGADTELDELEVVLEVGLPSGPVAEPVAELDVEVRVPLEELVRVVTELELVVVALVLETLAFE
jgi:hypothetical protein